MMKLKLKISKQLQSCLDLVSGSMKLWKTSSRYLLPVVSFWDFCGSGYGYILHRGIMKLMWVFVSGESLILYQRINEQTSISALSFRHKTMEIDHVHKRILIFLASCWISKSYLFWVGLIYQMVTWPYGRYHLVSYHVWYCSTPNFIWINNRCL